MDLPIDQEEPGTPKLTRIQTQATYSFQDQRGWRQWRVLRPGRGMYHDVKRRLPFYWSDITDAWTYRTFASTVRMYFVNLLPAIAFTLDMYRRTGEFFGINEALFSSALAAMVFSVLACQPLTIVGVTGLISLFNYTIYDIVGHYDITLYPKVMAWTGIWAAVFHWIVSFGNYCDYMGYITDFSSESFGIENNPETLIDRTVKGVEELVNEFEVSGNAAGYLSCIIAILYFGSVYSIEKLGSSVIWKPWFRGILADYAYPRNWVIDFWNLDVGWVFVALPFGFLTMLLFYYDHNVSSLTAQARQFPLKKPAGFHWDFFLLGCTTFVAGVIGLPMPNGLVPQAPVHTDSLTNYETRLDLIKTKDHDITEIRKPLVEATAVVEQRVSHFLMGLALWGTMTGPLLVWGSIESNGILQKLIYLNSERRFLAPENPLNDISRKKISLYIGLQVLGVTITVAISQTIAAIGFPVLIIALIPLRTFLMPRWFTSHELSTLDDLTANNKAVLASLGGRPTKMKEYGQKDTEEEDPNRRIAEGLEHVQSDQESDLHRQRSHSAVRQRMGSITRATEHRLRSQSRAYERSDATQEKKHGVATENTENR
ncbi:hypothetical protein N0V90_003552 [Kalmusia sp. IMI 367209]|nr:hypothetical protein N0V90_003552 [Kalmusia sp. IMI 367209]